MTYTFKLARRLAVSRTFGMLPALILFAACSGGDATGPEGSPGTHPSGTQDSWRPREIVPVAVRINPSQVTVETNQLIRFMAHGRTSAGDSVGAPVTWSATGGTILPDGRFSSAAVGSFMVTVGTRVRGEERIDTATVQVVRRHPELALIQVTPEAATLAPGANQQFGATGRLRDGRPVPVGAVWQAGGGSIDAGGNYVAGDTAGTYLVIATSPRMTLADTASVTIRAPAPLPPPPASPPESLPSNPPLPLPVPPDSTPSTPPAPTPVLQKVTLLPSSATLARGATRQFVAYGRMSNGDSVSVNVVFVATGGTVTTRGLYTAGPTAGSFRVIASSGSLADTSTVTVTVPLGSGSVTGGGIPFGPFGLLAAGVSTAPYTLNMGAVSATSLAAQIAEARAKKIRLILSMTGGAHVNYLTNRVFDEFKWKTKMDTYNTAAIKDAVAAAVADGTIVGNSVMDEPNVSGLGDGNTWGPRGTMTKVRVDGLCAYVKAMFPTLPVGVTHGHDMFEPTKSYRVCDFFADQFANRRGEVSAYRDAGVAMAKRDGMAIMFSLNILSGGIQAARDGLWDCPLTTTGGRGTHEPNCRMTPEQVRDWGQMLGSAGCAMLLWRYDDAFMSRPENLQAFKDVANFLATVPAKPCRRS